MGPKCGYKLKLGLRRHAIRWISCSYSVCQSQSVDSNEAPTFTLKKDVTDLSSILSRAAIRGIRVPEHTVAPPIARAMLDPTPTKQRETIIPP